MAPREVATTQPASYTLAMPKRTARSAALVITLVVGAIAAHPATPVSAAEPPTPPKTVETWAFCGVDPDSPVAATAVRAMAQAGGIDATLGPCNIPDDPYTPVNPSNRYVSPDVYMRLVQLNATVGMKTVVYDARLYNASAPVRNAAIAFWAPVLSNIAAWDIGDEYNPAITDEWDTLIERWTIMRNIVEPATGVPPYVNHLATSLDEALADLPGAERLLSFDKYDGDKGVSLAQQFDSQVTKLMCAVNAFDFSFTSTPTSIRTDMDTLIGAGCDQILVFGGYPVYDDPMHLFGTFSIVDASGAPTARAPAAQEGSGHSSLIPVGPIRLLETRTGPGLGTVDGGFFGGGIRPADSVLPLGIVGRGRHAGVGPLGRLERHRHRRARSRLPHGLPVQPATTDIVQPQLRIRHDASGRGGRPDQQRRRHRLRVHPDTHARRRRSHRLLLVRRQLQRDPACSSAGEPDRARVHHRSTLNP